MYSTHRLEHHVQRPNTVEALVQSFVGVKAALEALPGRSVDSVEPGRAQPLRAGRRNANLKSLAKRSASGVRTSRWPPDSYAGQTAALNLALSWWVFIRTRSIVWLSKRWCLAPWWSWCCRSGRLVQPDKRTRPGYRATIATCCSGPSRNAMPRFARWTAYPFWPRPM
jgi:hypothetical protein